MTESTAVTAHSSPSSTAAAPNGETCADALEALCAFAQRHPRLFVLTGAGISTDSGIPGYRDANGNWMRAQPIEYKAFVSSESARRRYWARSMVGWPMLAEARPNAAHRALARLEQAARVATLVTQNVDGLHQRAGSNRVIELHGSIRDVICLACGAGHSRESVQDILAAENPGLAGAFAQPSADGDAHLEWADLDTFHVPACPHCGGMLKPSVVFFGENVPRSTVEAAAAALEAADAMLVIGSSLMVYSGYRFCVWAARAGMPVAAVNLGRTRADAMLALKVAAPCGDALAALAERMA